MKRTHITDVLKVTLALLITGGMASAMTPQPVTPTQASITPEVTANVQTVTPVEPEKPAEPTPVTAVPTKWEDNPNKCNQDTHYIAAEAPFNCIEKPKPAAAVTPAPQRRAAASFGGSCADWIAGAGISEVGSANELIRRESGCNPYARNASSGACGVAQELPCGKSGCSLGDGACQVKWMNSYVISRYGSWAAAVSFHDRNNWY